MSQYAVIKKLAEEAVATALAGFRGESGSTPDAGDVTQLKRENTGLRNKVRELEGRVKVLEDAIRTPPVTARAQTAAVKGSTSGK